MENLFWDKRYEENTTVYGEAPNVFFKSFIDTHKPGSLLLPAEGEGRNAIYAASKGWEVDAFDFSKVAKEKALKLAAEKKLSINYENNNIEDFIPTKQYNAVGLIYVHLPESVRKIFHQKIYQSITTGGFLVFEAFAKEQLKYTSGGPKDITMLYDATSICSDFQFLNILSCGQKKVALNEGVFHSGNAEVLQLIGQKL